MYTKHFRQGSIIASTKYMILFKSPSGQNIRKAVYGSVFFDNMALYFEYRIKKKRTPSDRFFGHLGH